MFGKLKQYRLRKKPHGSYARKQMNKAAKKAGFTRAAMCGNAYYVEVMKQDNIYGSAVKVIHYLHNVCTRVGQFNETCCVSLFPDGEMKVHIHMVGDCSHCKYHWIMSSSVALQARDDRAGPRGYGTHIRA